LNVGHTFLYFLIGARTLSEEFRIKSENWYKKFRVVESIGELVAVILFFAQVVSKNYFFKKRVETNFSINSNHVARATMKPSKRPQYQ
jgi:hypothetical protein